MTCDGSVDVDRDSVGDGESNRIVNGDHDCYYDGDAAADDCITTLVRVTVPLPPALLHRL